ncbi:MAG: hypothetical protein ACREDF_11040 [Thermoplasmata archaeon]
MADLLNFNPKRNLDFDARRPLQFDPLRPLEFDVRRNLDFDMNRDLGFGRRGVVFRGFVCPICGALVTEEAKRCSECGAVFEGEPRASRPPGAPAGAKPSPPSKSKGPVPPIAKAGTGSPAAYCAFCGARQKPGDAFCANCGARVSGSSEAVQLPSKKTTPVTRDWRSPKER